MLDDQGWEGEAGGEVRKCMYAVARAQAAVETAVRDLGLANAELDAMERDLETAKRVYHAGRQDQENRLQAQSVSSQKREWLKELAHHQIFGSGEMRDAATAIGWNPTDAALRVLASDYRKVGYLLRVSHGVMKVNRERIEAVLGPIFTGEAEIEKTDELAPTEESDTVLAAATARHDVENTDDYLDDDVPF